MAHERYLSMYSTCQSSIIPVRHGSISICQPRQSPIGRSVIPRRGKKSATFPNSALSPFRVRGNGPA